LRSTDPTLKYEEQRSTIPPVSSDSTDLGTRTLYVFAGLALIGAIAYAFWVHALEQRDVGHPPEVPTVPSVPPTSSSASTLPTDTPGTAVVAPSASIPAVPSASSPTPSASVTTHVHHRPRPTEGTDNPYGSAPSKETVAAPPP
jgi:hypothetical protein